MSNRNTKSKSPNIKKQQNFDKDLIKYLILQKITKPSVPAEMITKTQTDEDSELNQFRQEIEIKFKKCKINQQFKFPKENYESSSDNSLSSLKDVTLYQLNHNNLQSITDATQPQFIKLLNQKLIKLTDLIQNETSNENPILNLNYSRLQKLRVQNLSNTSITEQIDLTVTSQGRESMTQKHNSNIGFRATPTLSKEKKNPPKKILNIEQQKLLNNAINNPFHIRNNQGNKSLLNNTVYAQDKKNIENIRIKTEYNDQESNLSHFYLLSKSRPKNRETNTKIKKQDSSQNHKMLNYTIDSHMLEKLKGTRNAKSQNKNYQN